MALTITIINNKGGTGKTTTALNLGGALVKLKYSVLLIDMDSQCNLTNSVGVINPDKHIGNLILRQNDVNEVVYQSEMFSVIPSSDKLLDYELQINAEPGRDFLLKESLKKVEDKYDYIIIDCPPSLGALSVNSLVAADYYIVPMQAENFAFIGLDTIIHTAEKVKQRMNPDLKLAGILLTRYTVKTKFAQAVITNIKNNSDLTDKLFRTAIRQDISLMESTAFHQCVFEYAPKSRGAEDYLKFAKEIINLYGPTKKSSGRLSKSATN